MVRENSYYGKINKTIGFYNFACIGTENSLTDCPSLTYTYDEGKLFALNTSVAGVYCQPPEPTEAPTVCPITPTLPPSPICKNGDIQLAEGTIPSEGRLMYCYNTQWSPFCSVDTNTAAVACKSLGYSGASMFRINITFFICGNCMISVSCIKCILLRSQVKKSARVFIAVIITVNLLLWKS